jgi:hypothetical protein
MKHGIRDTARRLLEATPALAVFILVWSVLATLGSTLVDADAVVSTLNETPWLRFLSSRVRDVLIGQWWQPLAALFFAALSYPLLRPAGVALGDRLFPELTDDAAKVLEALYKGSWWPERKLATLARLKPDRLSECLRELESKGLVYSRPGTKPRNRGKLIWQISARGNAYLKKQLGTPPSS